MPDLVQLCRFSSTDNESGLGGARSVYPAELKFQKAELLNPGLRFDEKLGTLWDKILEVIDPEAEDERPFFKNVFIHGGPRLHEEQRDPVGRHWGHVRHPGAGADGDERHRKDAAGQELQAGGLDITGLPECNGNSTVTVNRPDFRLVLPPS